MMLLGSSVTELPQILELGAVTNLLVHPMPVLAEELTITAHKLMRGDLFGVEKYLLWGTELHEVMITRASQRAHIVSELAEAVRSRGQSARVASMTMLVADELISNAVHNAPVDAAGVHYRAELEDLRQLGHARAKQHHAGLGTTCARRREERRGRRRQRRGTIDDDQARRDVLEQPSGLLEVVGDLDLVARHAENSLHRSLGLAIGVHDEDRCFPHVRFTVPLDTSATSAIS